MSMNSIESRVQKACDRAERIRSDVTLIAVSKTRSAAEVQGLIDQGQRHFGENKVQEAAGKFEPILTSQPDIRLHLIGPIQTNKAKAAVELAHYIHSVDRPKLADAIARHADALGSCPQLFVQVNIGEEPQKAGVIPAQLPALLKQCSDLDLPVVGLMCIPPADQPAAGHFAFLGELAKRSGLSGLSMGMSADFEGAIELGATYIRVGSAIFGPRDYS